MILTLLKKGFVKSSTYTTKSGTTVFRKAHTDKRTKKADDHGNGKIIKWDSLSEKDKRSMYMKAMVAKYGKLNIIPPMGTIFDTGGEKDNWVLKFKSPKTGKTVHAYSGDMMREKSLKKFAKIKAMREKIPNIRQQLNDDLKSKDLTKTKVIAAISRLIDKTYIRIGTEKNAEHGVFGITTLRNNHVTIDGNKITLKYVGKHKIEHEKILVDNQIAGIMRELKSNNKGNIPFFSVDGRPIRGQDVNKYLKKFDITAKHFRTFHASREMFEYLKGLPHPKTKKETLKILKNGIEFVSSKLGNTPAVAKTSYIMPEILNNYALKYGMEPLIKSINTSNNNVKIPDDWGRVELTKKEEQFFDYLDEISEKQVMSELKKGFVKSSTYTNKKGTVVHRKAYTDKRIAKTHTANNRARAIWKKDETHAQALQRYEANHAKLIKDAKETIKHHEALEAAKKEGKTHSVHGIAVDQHHHVIKHLKNLNQKLEDSAQRIMLHKNRTSLIRMKAEEKRKPKVAVKKANVKKEIKFSVEPVRRKRTEGFGLFVNEMILGGSFHRKKEDAEKLLNKIRKGGEEDDKDLLQIAKDNKKYRLTHGEPEDLIKIDNAFKKQAEGKIKPKVIAKSGRNDKNVVSSAIKKYEFNGPIDGTKRNIKALGGLSNGQIKKLISSEKWISAIKKVESGGSKRSFQTDISDLLDVYVNENIHNEIKKNEPVLQNKPERKTYSISHGSGYGGKPYKVGNIIKNTSQQGSEYLKIVGTSEKYIGDEGMSFGVGDEQGFIYMATAVDSAAPASILEKKKIDSAARFKTTQRIKSTR